MKTLHSSEFSSVIYEIPWYLRQAKYHTGEEMKFLVTLALAASISSAFAIEEFGGMKLHSSVTKDQMEIFKNDLKYLYKTPIKAADKDFLKVANILIGDGPNYHNWLLNRVHYIVGESFSLQDEKNLVAKPFEFPTTPIPDVYKQEANNEDKGVTVMTNIGASTYIIGKMNNIAIGLKLDDEVAFFTSPRIGVIQVGEGLFDPRFLYNKDVKAAANSVSRLATLFHEARHSDGRGKSTGLSHEKCPAYHTMAGNYACERIANGPYTIGALSQRQFLASCDACSTTEKNALASEVLDSFSRIIDESEPAKIKTNLESLIVRYQAYLTKIQGMINSAPADKKAEIQKEIDLVTAEVVRLQASVKTIPTVASAKPVAANAAPEGEFDSVLLMTSKKLMEDSLKK